MLRRITLSIMLITMMGFAAQASHLMGGSVCYEYLSYNPNTQLHKFKLKAEVYRDMSGANFTPPMTMSVYLNNPPTYSPASPATIQLAEVDRDTLNFNELIGVNCTLTAPTVVTSEIFYLEGEIELPSTLQGYHFMYQTCCRNPTIDNVVTAGMSWYAFIPATFYKNNSPCYVDNPVLFVCKQVNWIMSNRAVDPDGDLLFYRLITPFDGDAIPPLDDTVAYQKTIYNGQNPFGVKSTVQINSGNGLMNIWADSLGVFVVAVEVLEYRNGFLLSNVIRDLQIGVVDCQGETPAELAIDSLLNPLDSSKLPYSGGTNIVLNIREGDSICYILPFYDPDGDSILIHEYGQIFNLNPPATLDKNYKSGSDGSAVDALFCWRTECGQSRKVPWVANLDVENVGGCPQSTTPYKIIVYVDPYDLGPGDIIGPDTVCANTFNNIYYVQDTATTYIYKWFISGGALVSQNKDTARIFWGTTFNTGVIQVVRLYGCYTDTLSYTVSINPAPIARVDTLHDICIGDTIELDASLSSATGWHWSPAINIDDTTSSKPLVWPATTQTYRLIVTNNICQPDTKNVHVNVHQLPTLNVLPYPDTTICEGDSATLRALSGAGMTYAWTPKIGLDDSTLFNPMASPPDTTLYKVRVTNIAGCFVEDSMTVNINSAWVDAGPLDTVTVCLGDTFFSQVTAQDASGGILWTPATGLSSATVLSPDMYPAVTTKYVVEVTNVDGCVDKDSITVEVVNTKLIANAGKDTSICLGENLMLVGAGGTRFTWSPGASLSATNIFNPIATPVVTTTYTLIVNSSSGNCVGDTTTVTVTVDTIPVVDAGPKDEMCLGNSLTLNPAGPFFPKYVWTPKGSLSNNKLRNPISTANNTTLYTLEVTDANGCSTSDTVTIQVNRVNVTATATPDSNICADPIQLDAAASDGSGTYNYLWFPNFNLDDNQAQDPIATPTADVDYTVEVTDQVTGCKARDIVKINSLNGLPLAIQNSDTTICIGSGVDITAKGGYPSITLDSIIWSPTTGIADTTLLNTRITPTVTTTYVLKIKYNDCERTDNITIAVSDTPVVWIQSPDSICLNDELMLFALTQNVTGQIDFAWDNGDSGKTVSYTMSEAGNATYTVTATNAFNCSSTATKDVEIVDKVDVVATAERSDNSVPLDTVFIYAGESALLQGQLAGPYKDFVWSPPIEYMDDPTALETAVAPDSSMMFYLTAWSDAGCPYLDSVWVEVAPTSKVRAPVVFTPNGDGVNDFFTVRAEGWENPTLQIFNRWGQNVFTALDLKSINTGWDGKLDGADQPMGNYIWKFTGDSKDANDDEKFGSFSLIR